MILLSLTLASTALASEYRRLSVDCKGRLPFGQRELQTAIKLRLPLMRIDLARSLPRVEVQAVPGDRASIKVGTSRRIVSLEGLSSADAVRIVALLSLDLISNQQRTDADQGVAVDEGDGTSGAIFIGVSPRASLGVSQWDLAFEPTVDISVKVSRRLLIFVECGVSWAGAGEGARVLSLVEIPIRAGVGFRHRWFEARAGVALRPYFVSGAGEDRGVLAGAGLGVYFRRAFSRWFTGYAAVGVDLFPRRKEFQVDGETVLTTAWAVPWLGLGAGWQGG